MLFFYTTQKSFKREEHQNTTNLFGRSHRNDCDRINNAAHWDTGSSSWNVVYWKKLRKQMLFPAAFFYSLSKIQLNLLVQCTRSPTDRKALTVWQNVVQRVFIVFHISCEMMNSERWDKFRHRKNKRKLSFCDEP